MRRAAIDMQRLESVAQPVPRHVIALWVSCEAAVLMDAKGLVDEDYFISGVHA